MSEGGRAGPGGPLFLEKRPYRRSRLSDGARMLPLVGALLLLLPVILVPDVGSLSARLIYVFSVWLGLIAGALLLSRALCRTEVEPPAPPPDEGG